LERDDRRPERWSEADQWLLVPDAVENRRHSGQQHADIQTACSKRDGQGSDDVSKAAGLDQRKDFGGNVQDAQEVLYFLVR